MDSNKKDKGESWQDLVWKSHKYNERKNIKSGTYLRSFCPFCLEELTRDNMIHLELIAENDVSGWIELSPYLNSFDRKTDIKIPQGHEVKDLLCPHCHKSLKVEGVQCGFGDAHVASFLVGISNFKVPFYICMREGCHWHAISSDDEDKIILDDSHEW